MGFPLSGSPPPRPRRFLLIVMTTAFVERPLRARRRSERGADGRSAGRPPWGSRASSPSDGVAEELGDPPEVTRPTPSAASRLRPSGRRGRRARAPRGDEPRTPSLPRRSGRGPARGRRSPAPAGPGVALILCPRAPAVRRLRPPRRVQGRLRHVRRRRRRGHQHQGAGHRDADAGADAHQRGAGRHHRGGGRRRQRHH